MMVGHELCYYCDSNCDFDLRWDNSSSDKVHQHQHLNRMMVRLDSRSH